MPLRLLQWREIRVGQGEERSIVVELRIADRGRVVG